MRRNGRTVFKHKILLLLFLLWASYQYILTLSKIKLSLFGVAKAKTNPAMCNTLGLAVIKSMLFSIKKKVEETKSIL